MATRTLAAPVPMGPVAYARNLRRLGWLAGLIVPAVLLGLTMLAKNRFPCTTGTCTTGFATNWVLPGLALPTAMLWGIPLLGSTARVVGVFATSALLWALLGYLAARRATLRPVASWRTWCREFAVLLLGVWLGVIVGLLALGALVGKSLLT